MSCERICPLVTLVCVLFSGDCHVRIQKKTHAALLSPLIKFERMPCVFSQNCLNKSQIPCNRKVAWKTNTLELLYYASFWDLRKCTDFFLYFLKVCLVLKWFGSGYPMRWKKYENLFQKQGRSRFIFILPQGSWCEPDIKFCPNEYLWARCIK